jgi:peptidyl-tRNA hydrolase, PTH1 family
MPPRNLLATGNPTSRVVAGLGNHERQYAATRHNVGARAVERAARALGLRPSPGLNPLPLSRSGIVLPDGFMNDSGGLLRRAVQRWHPLAANLLVVHDELDLPLGQVQLKAGGGHGGHNGLRDIIAQLGTADFRRLRIGIGRPPSGEDPADYVLASFRPVERAAIEAALAEAGRLVDAFLAPGRV